MIVLYSRDHNGLGMAHKSITKKPATIFSYDDQAEKLGPNKPSDQPEMLSTSYYGILNKLFN